ncbi:MAG: crotonase/enoyl-CoA hydratase family protein [Deltaproteobacteria bacterium]|nr:crotonase/enoyl-CoA hydratase family protein [Deltaproteobacteria bacterium]
MPVCNYTLDGSTALIQMDDGKANALSDVMITELGAAFDRAEKEASAIVLTGREGRFCAGFDLKIMMSGPDNATALLRRGADLYMKMYATPLPLVIACTGHALAGGALVVLTGDVRIGASGPFRLGLNEVTIGLPVPILAMELARDRLAPFELSRATLQGTVYGPDESVKAGWLDEVVAPGEVLARAKAEATRLAGISRMAYAATKIRLRRKTIADIKTTLDEDMRTLMSGT